MGIILSRFCYVAYWRILWSENKDPHHIQSLESRCLSKKSAFNVARNLVIVVKFTFQIVFSNSRQNGFTKGFTAGKSFCRTCSQTLFFGGREATTANTSAARRLQSHLKSSKWRFIYSCKKYCLIRIKLNFVKHLKIKIGEKSSTQRFDVAMTSLLSDKDKTKNWLTV